ncbi:hypothetical protein BDV23DRAFT_183602 [Aspergillus alliaceus]|uniref:Uncharacterized protein n=1 Tax=Petromyces alliaceus TaxID=209559 RepID=A0A5N7C8K3_PETAA|nr:hypothetical protein BDV23DRAFT_183602 [Aspergillus alliaceus]
MRDLPEWSLRNTFQELSDPQRARMHERYPISKLLETLLAKATAKQLGSNRIDDIIVNSFTSDSCTSGLTENVHGITGFAFWLLAKATASTAEVRGQALITVIAHGVPTPGRGRARH